MPRVYLKYPIHLPNSLLYTLPQSYTAIPGLRMTYLTIQHGWCFLNKCVRLTQPLLIVVAILYLYLPFYADFDSLPNNICISSFDFSFYTPINLQYSWYEF